MHTEVLLRIIFLLAGILIGLLLGFIADQIDTALLTKTIGNRYPDPGPEMSPDD